MLKSTDIPDVYHIYYTMSTVRYIPTALATKHQDTPISELYLCAQPADGITQPSKPSSPKTNHWVLHCTMSPNKSLRFDPSPSGPNLSMVLIITEEDSHCPLDGVKNVHVGVSGLTVQKFAALLVSAEYDQYRFTPSGQGCRYWMHRVVELLEVSGHAPNAAETALAVDALRRVWAQGEQLVPGPEQSPMAPGTFLALEAVGDA